MVIQNKWYLKFNKMPVSFSFIFKFQFLEFFAKKERFLAKNGCEFIYSTAV